MSVVEDSFKKIMQDRRSIRHYDKNIKINKDELTDVINKSVLAPSGVNLQTWRFVVISSEEGKKKINPLFKRNRLQLETSAAMVFLFGDLCAVEKIDHIYESAVTLGIMPEEVKNSQLASLKPMYQFMSKENNLKSVLIDGGIVAMNFMLVARSHGYDTNAIGGFDQENCAEIVGLDSTRYVPILALSIGKAIESGFPSYRLSADEITSWL